MIETFESLGDMSLFSQSGGIAGGISQALFTTQLGLAVAIPGMAGQRPAGTPRTRAGDGTGADQGHPLRRGAPAPRAQGRVMLMRHRQRRARAPSRTSTSRRSSTWSSSC
ncbi:MAG: MotA/TolQ/ExbB proton channel family protein [Halofilum sp. (in: g-proteobacteria)]|nr:MotA/TolQ/ExbB proton channel family protein [Halofilum sp. (in: g-proteobacteria)]